MSNEQTYYFGAYLEIKVNQIEKQIKQLSCKNGHSSKERFCSECGELVKEKIETKLEYPMWVTDIIGDEWEDELAVITPPSLEGNGIIIAIGNLDKDSGEWLTLDRWSDKPELKIFPTEKEIEEMKYELEINYRHVIEALNAAPSVVSVEIKAGYVIDWC